MQGADRVVVCIASTIVLEGGASQTCLEVLAVLVSFAHQCQFECLECRACIAICHTRDPAKKLRVDPRVGTALKFIVVSTANTSHGLLEDIETVVFSEFREHDDSE